MPVADALRGSIGGQLLICPERPEKTFEQADQFVDRGRAAPQAGVGIARTVPENIDETLGLARLDGIRLRVQRNQDIQADIGQQTPPQAVRNFVEAG